MTKQEDVFLKNRETAIEIVRGDIYENERTKYAHKEGLFLQSLYGEGLILEYTPQTFGSYQEIKTRRGRRVGGTDSGTVDGIDKKLSIGNGNLNGNRANDVNSILTKKEGNEVE